MSEKEAKKRFFEDLYALDDTTESEAENEIPVILENSKKKKIAPLVPEQKASTNARKSSELGRTMSSPLPVSSTSETPSDGPSVLETTGPPLAPATTTGGKKPAAPPTLSRTRSAGFAGIAIDTSRTSRKRKRGSSLHFMPESEQFFKGKNFFFLPNDDIAPARALRIRKAREWGALWIRDWKVGASHIIAEATLKYNDILKYLKIAALPPGIILVNELYPADCIVFRSLVNPAQKRYQLEGQQEIPQAQVTPISADSSAVSLQLKPEASKVPLKTPSRTEGSDEIAATRQLEVLAQEDAARRKEALLKRSRPSRPKDALDEAIEEAKQVEGLPLDSDEDEETTKSIVEDDNVSEEEVEKNRSKDSKATKRPPTKHWQENFSCMQKHDGLNKEENPNARTIEVLQKMADYYDRTRDNWRVVAYRKAIASLRKQTVKITTKYEAITLPFVGTRLADKIEEIVWTNRLSRLDNASFDDTDAVLQLFLGIYGAGFAQAQAWISQGHRTLESLATSASLTTNQQTGLDHHEDFKTRIPRAEVGAHTKLLREHVAAVSTSTEVTVGGSYRRGAPDCGDIDFLITSPSLPITALRTLLLESLIPRLFAVRYLRAALATTKSDTGTKWHGAACLPAAKEQIWRRVDFLLVPWEEMGAALIYWTGNDIFNRSMRLLASRKGMRLNQRGLFKDAMRGPGRVKVTDGELVEGKSEKRIFELLGVPWRPPEHRIC